MTNAEQLAELLDDYAKAERYTWNDASFKARKDIMALFEKMRTASTASDTPPVGYINERGEPVLKKLTPHDIEVCECGGLPLLYTAKTKA
ncbi:hypothetical protein AWB74_02105 [Caballeronia arvi]|uniref:Uncharacterized protein n=1 Tax=Caballeronia arvi TaxID=1777135 RepID=A0A158HRU7_9BURK|nr:hypothetical protein [Caballeronia arvi]SAL47105.1 hypothetical protein AWB74_02105 [Caballeronia arvi]